MYFFNLALFDLVQDCGPIANSLSNGTATQTGTLYEDVASYVCDAGFMIARGVVERWITCNATGSWNDTAPSACVPIGTVTQCSHAIYLLHNLANCTKYVHV